MEPGPLEDLVLKSISGFVPGQIIVLHLNGHAAMVRVQCKASLWWTFGAHWRYLLTLRSSAKSPVQIVSTPE